MTATLNMAIVLDEMPETDAVTAEVLQQIIASIGSQPVSDYAQAIPFTFIGVVKTALPDVTDKAQRKLIADELHAYLVEAGVIGGTTAPAAAPQGPIEVTVKQEKTFDTMRLPQLLAALAEDPGCYSEVYPQYVAPNPQFVKALAKANKDKVAVLKDKKLDVAGTVAYIEHLSDPNGQPQPNWRGSKLTTLAMALGRKASVMLNPFTGEFMKDGLDSFGRDWTTMPEPTYRSSLHAVLTGKIEEPQGSEVRRWTIELFTSPLPPMWQGLVEEFEQAVEDEDPIAILLSLPLSTLHTALQQADQQALGGKVPGGTTPAAAPKPEMTEDGYKAKLYDNAESRLNVGGSLNRGRGVLTSIRVGGSCELDGTIVLEGGTVGGSSYGTCYVPRGYSVRAGGGNHMRVFERSYKALCELAGLI